MNNYHSVPATAIPRLSSLDSNQVWFGVFTCVALVLSHAIAYMSHEYAHSFLAWALGWMANPLNLDYGDPTLYNILFLGDVGDNVNYAPIFASGHGVQAAAIALSGTFVGNAALYFVMYHLAGLRQVSSSRLGCSIVYWIALMCAGNVWGYVPIRSITTHADIALAAQGLGLNPWVLLPFLLVPALYVIHHFFTRMLARCVAPLTQGQPATFALVIALTAYWFFAFYGGDGTNGSYGSVSQFLAIISKYLLFPVAVMWLAASYRPAGAAERPVSAEGR